MPRRVALPGLALILFVSGVAATAALRRTSTTFDEIVLVAAGAHALETGDRAMIVDQPPLAPLLYGLAVRTAHPSYPVATRPLTYDDRWNYARAFYFDAGNDPRRLAFRSRLVGVACLLILVAAVFAFTRRAAPDPAALVAAALVAFLPSVLAHAGVAYNDLPLALAYFVGLVALDAFVRTPSVARGALAGVAGALAVGVKFSGAALIPVALVLVGMEAAGRRGDRGWWRALGGGAAVGVLAAWATTAALYAGDPALIGLRLGYYMTAFHAGQGHTAPAFFLGMTSARGWWWYFPVVFFLMTSLAFQLLVAAAAFAGVRALAREGAGAALASPLRAPLAGLVVFVAFLLTSHLNNGFRYALPALPPLAVLVAAGVSRVWRASGRAVRVALAALVALHAGSSLSAYPWFTSYVSAWSAGHEPSDLILDSSLDWGQGLLALRDWMAERDVGSVRLSYFGSALPAGYGIHYRPLESFLPLPPDPSPVADEPEWTAISATNLRGLYFGGQDPFAAYRLRTPDAVVGGSIFLFHDPAGTDAARPPGAAPG